MKKIMFRNYLVLFFVVLFVVSCASQGGIQPTMELQKPPGSFKTLVVEVKTDLPDRQGEVKELKEKIVQKLVEKGLNERINEHGDLKIDVKIIDVSGVSTAGRLMFGALAGRATVKATVDLNDTKENKKVGSFVVEGKSSGGSIFAGTTSQALEMAAEQIADYVAKKVL
jgi:hypothetical protein